MATTAQETFDRLLIAAGFKEENGQLSAGLIGADTTNSSLSADLRYRDIFSKSVDHLRAIDLVYEVPSQVSDLPGNTSIYFKVLEYPDLKLETKIRNLVWNQGRAPTLWVVTPNTIRIYDSFARPQQEDDVKSHLIAELKRIGNQVQGIADFHKRLFDSGDFWLSDYGKKIAKSERVDEAMLKDLSRTEYLLTTDYQLPARVAHALLGRVIFVSYLVDRGILKHSYFQDKYRISSFTELLANKTATYHFFNWLYQTFNGDLFPVTSEEVELVKEGQLEVLRHFLSGVDMSSYPAVVQGRLWPYKFDVIPIELISSIYEMFAHNRNYEEAEARSIHYTRLQLVELVLSRAMAGLPHTARVLDPACGSGVFLVEAFRRLARLREQALGREIDRTQLQDILRHQLFGIDLDSDAVHIAAFSLYLTLLELDPNPEPPEALRFPRLVSTNDFDEERAPNLYIQNYLNTIHNFNQTHPFVDRAIDLIVGNPPWTALKRASTSPDLDHSGNGDQWGNEYAEMHHVPDRKPDLAFMIRSRDFANERTRIAYIVCSRLLYQQSTIPPEKRWLTSFLRDFTVDMVINFSDFVGEDVLFGGYTSTRLPAAVIFYRILSPDSDHNILYIAPQWYPAVKQQNEVTITPGDVHTIAQEALEQKPFLWKSAFRGTPRDFRLLDKLQNLPTLRKVLNDVGMQRQDLNRGLTFGQGEQKDASTLKGIPYLDSNNDCRYGVNVNELQLFEEPTVAKKSNLRKFKLPVLILCRSLLNNRARTAVIDPGDERTHVAFDQMYFGITFATVPWLAYRINALLNSKLAFYMAFMFSSSVGWDRRLVEAGDWLQVRLPPSIVEQKTHLIWDELLAHERWLRMSWKPDATGHLAAQITEVEKALDQATYRLYGLSSQEIVIIEDTITYTIERYLRRAETGFSTYPKPSEDDLERYARRLCTQLNSLLQYADVELSATTLTFGSQSRLAACRFVQQPRGKGNQVEHIELTSVSQLLNQISADLRSELADHLYVQRDLRVYQGNSFWIIKQADRKSWNETAALNDADTVLREHMEAFVVHD